MIRKLTLKKEREHETNEASIAGNVMRDLIAHVLMRTPGTFTLLRLPKVASLRTSQNKVSSFLSITFSASFFMIYMLRW